MIINDQFGLPWNAVNDAVYEADLENNNSKGFIFALTKFYAGHPGTSVKYYKKTSEGLEKGLIWVDTQQGTSIVANYTVNYNHTSSRLDITSNNFSSNNIPLSAKHALQQFVKNVPKVQFIFFEVDKNKNINLAW